MASSRLHPPYRRPSRGSSRRPSSGLRARLNLQIPKSVKATSCEHVAKLFFQSSVIYAETKYDGERMQIHVDMGLPRDEQIRIFSKSKRDSTGDRDATLSYVSPLPYIPAIQLNLWTAGLFGTLCVERARERPYSRLRWWPIQTTWAR